MPQRPPRHAAGCPVVGNGTIQWGQPTYEPLRRDRRKQLDELRTGDGRPLPSQLKTELLRQIEVIKLLVRQIAEVEAECDAGR